MLVLEDVDLHRTVQLQLPWHSDWGIDLDYCNAGCKHNEKAKRYDTRR